MRVSTRIKVLPLAIAAILGVGTIGFHLIENYTYFDAFYMTLITITTIGYGEIRTLSPNGRLFNTFLIFFGVTINLQALGAIAQSFVEREFSDLMDAKRRKRMIDQLKDHFIICGFGRVGRGAAQEMQRMKVPFVVCDKNEEKVERAMKMGMLAVLADCTRDETLRSLHIERAKGVVAALASDADNMFLILSAKTLNGSVKISARAGEEEAEEKLRRAGADMVFAPYYLTGHRLAQSILKPHVQEFMDIFTRNIGLNAAVEQVKVAEGAEAAGRALKEIHLRRNLGVIVLAIRRSDGRMEFNPSADAVINAGDYLIVMGEEANLRNLEAMLLGGKA